MLLYLAINFFTILFPLLFSFESRIQYYRHWRFVIPSILITASWFLIWDYFFTKNNIWSFNDDFITGIHISNLPIEEILFFFCIPFACFFIYVIVRELIFLPATLMKFRWEILVSALFFLFIGLKNITLTYTAVACTSLGLWLLLLFILRINFFTTFLIAFLLQLIPFIIVNGMLTAFPVVEYNDQFNLGIRFFTIPIEDFVYSGLLMIMNVTFYEWFKAKKVTGNF
ncbi:MAG: lycopene cyclase domain-containing protein [Chitinophagales bacterium]|nr:lycopene cyclase domain-containing protein [Chitinophagales bacterium]